MYLYPKGRHKFSSPPFPFSAWIRLVGSLLTAEGEDKREVSIFGNESDIGTRITVTVVEVWPGSAVRNTYAQIRERGSFSSLKRAEEEDLSAFRCALREDVTFQRQETI